MSRMSQGALSKLLLTFQKAQSEYLGLETPASHEELLRLDALSKRSRQSPLLKIGKKRSSNPVKRLSYNAWKKVDDEGLSSGEAKAKYNELVYFLKKKYKLGRNKNQSSKGSTTRCGRTMNTRMDVEPPRDESDRAKICIMDAFTLQYEAEAKLGNPMIIAQSASTTATDIISNASATSMPSAIGASPLTPPLLSTFNLSDSTTKYNPKPHKCTKCGRKTPNASSNCHACQPPLTKVDKLQKLLAKVAEDHEDFALSNNKISYASINNNNCSDKTPKYSITAPNTKIELILPNIAFLDISDSIWRCAICGWEIIAKDEGKGMCGKGHFV